jgi:hypothetical protein
MGIVERNERKLARQRLLDEQYRATRTHHT